MLGRGIAPWGHGWHSCHTPGTASKPQKLWQLEEQSQLLRLCASQVLLHNSCKNFGIDKYNRLLSGIARKRVNPPFSPLIHRVFIANKS